MPETYDYDATEAADRDKVRGLIGDTSQKDQQPYERVSDQVIDALLSAFAAVEDPVLRVAVECAAMRYRAVAGQKGSNERAPGLEPERRFERLRQVWEDLKARLDGTESTGGTPIMNPGGGFPCGVIQVKIGILDEPC